MDYSVLAMKTIFETDRKTDTLLRQMNIDNGITVSHSRGVNFLASLLADKLVFLTSREKVFLDWGTKLHDLGKAEVGTDILLKKEKLTKMEWEKIKAHPLIGFQKTQAIGFPREVTEIILYHHERYDGTGYPFGLLRNDIPLLARICSVVDAFEAMISNRPYRKALPYEAAFDELIGNRGKQFDPDIVDCFIALRPQILEDAFFIHTG